MDLPITDSQLRTGETVLTILHAFAREGAEGAAIVDRMMKGISARSERLIRSGQVEIKISGRSYTIAEDIGGIICGIGFLIGRWAEEDSLDFLPMTIQTLSHCLDLLKQRIPMTLTVISADLGTVAILAPGQPGKVVEVGTILLIAAALGIDEETVMQLENQKVWHLRPI